MTARKHVPVLRAVIVSFALLLAVAFALSAQASAMSAGANGSDAVTGATPQAPQMQDGQTPQMPGGEMPQFSDGQSFPQMPNGEAPQFSDGQLPQMPNGEAPQFSDGQLPQMPDGFAGFDGEAGENSPFSQQAPAAEGDASGDADLDGRAATAPKSGEDSGLTRVGNGFQSSESPRGIQIALWMLLGFGCALILGSIGLLIYGLVRHGRAKAAARVIEYK